MGVRYNLEELPGAYYTGFSQLKWISHLMKFMQVHIDSTMSRSEQTWKPVVNEWQWIWLNSEEFS